MALTVRLDGETERCLRELQAESGLDRSSLIRQLIHDRWRQRQPIPTIGERLGPPPPFLATLPAGSAEREHRRQRLQQHLQVRQQKRSQCDAS